MSTAALSVPALVPLDAARVIALEWSQPRRIRRRWDLAADGAPIATLNWRGALRRGFVARTAEGEWRIDGGFFGRHRIRREGEDGTRVTARSGFRRARLEREGLEPLWWRREGWMGTWHVLENAEKFPLVHLRRRRGFLRTGGMVTLEDAGRALPDLVPLLLLGWTLALTETHHHGH